MTEERKRLLHTSLAAGLFGIGAGVLLTAVIYWYEPGLWSWSNASLRSPLLGLAVVCILAGWGLGWLLERDAGFCGEIMLVPSAVAALAMTGLTWVGLAWLCDPLSGEALFTLIFAGVMFWIGGAGHAVWERLR